MEELACGVDDTTKNPLRTCGDSLCVRITSGGGGEEELQYNRQQGLAKRGQEVEAQFRNRRRESRSGTCKWTDWSTEVGRRDSADASYWSTGPKISLAGLSPRLTHLSCL